MAKAAGHRVWQEPLKDYCRGLLLAGGTQVCRALGRPPRLMRRGPTHRPVSVREPVSGLGRKGLRRVSWPEGANKKLQSRFVALRVRPAPRDYGRAQPHPELWLRAEWPPRAAEPTKYWLSNLPPETELTQLVRGARHRRIVEPDYLELKQELGLGHFEGRSWRGFHHHATLGIAAYGFLVAERSRFFPLSARRKARAGWSRDFSRLLAAGQPGGRGGALRRPQSPASGAPALPGESGSSHAARFMT